MSDEQQAWDRQENEPQIWYSRFTRYRLMEPTRSIAATFREEKESKGEEFGGIRRNVEAPGSWYDAAKDWQWEKRVAVWDSFLEDEIEKTIAIERKKVLRSRFALMHKRVEVLDRKAQQLIDITDNQDEIWIPDVKSIGTGPNATRVDLLQFNDASFRELREYLTDIADEMGERVKSTKTELTGKDGGPVIQNVVVYIPNNGRDVKEAAE